jgi:uncharacterized repeat protein (TIGR01451 family)
LVQQVEKPEPHAAVALFIARAALGFALALCTGEPSALGVTSYKQPGFSETPVFTGLTNPTTVRFLPDGRVVVAEKSGLIKLFPDISTNTYTVVADLRSQAHNFWDRGLLGLAVDPNFATNNYIYVLYTFDAPIGGTAPTWGPGDGTSDPCPTPPGATTDGCVVSGRLSRLTATGPDWTASEHVLINDWCQQFPSHSIGALNFGADGYLYLTGGDGASFDNADWGQFGGTSGAPPPTPKNPCGDPPAGVGGTETPPTAEGGALRSQSSGRAAGEPRLLNGSLLRVDPATGAGVPGNPFFSSTDVNAQRIVAYGMRNPFRFTIKPGTNDTFISDVGYNTWEELNRLPDPTTALNFGWPCYEGIGRQPSYDSANLNICETLYGTGSVTPPLLTYAHSDHVVPNDGCTTGSSAIAGLAFYTGGSNYPSNYTGALLFSDYSRNCMWVMFPNAGGDPDPTTTAAFAATAQGPVDIQLGPDGNFYYVDYNAGQLLRVEYGLHAVATASPTSGGIPLTVQFDGSGSQPAQAGDTLTYAWDLNGDGIFDDSTLQKPTYQYTVAGTYLARLKVTDQRGASDISAPITISADNGSPTAAIQSPPASLTWKVGDIIAFSGTGSDPQDGILPPSAFAWTIIIHHCPSDCHTHIYQTFNGVKSGSFPAPDHEYPSYLEIQLLVTDSDGNTGSASVSIQPQTVGLNFLTVPTGLQLSVGTLTAVAPFTDTVIVNSMNQLVAAPTQGAYPVIWEFASWSDGGAAAHVITAPATPVSYTATYATRADLSLGMSASPPLEACESDPITYTLTVANAGLSQATSVNVIDTPPAGATVLSAGGTGWACSITASVLCTLPTLDITTAPPITIVLTAPAGTALNAATVGSSLVDPNGANNSASSSITVNPAPALPSISATNWAPVGATGIPASVADHAGSSYTWTLSGGTLASGQGTAAVTVDAGAPGTTMGLRATETNSSNCVSPPASAKIQVDFLDAPQSYLFHDFIDTIARNGVTAGCGAGNYCPAGPSTRAQMAVFLLKSKYGSDHVPPPAVGLFLDVPVSDPFTPWIEELATLGVTGGCGGGNYCPASPVTRAQMAVFLLKTLLGPAYVPPAAVGIFGDVPPDAFAADWIEDLYARSITGGCQESPLLYCPDDPNTRGQMAAFLTKTFPLQ